MGLLPFITPSSRPPFLDQIGPQAANLFLQRNDKPLHLCIIGRAILDLILRERISDLLHDSSHYGQVCAARFCLFGVDNFDKLWYTLLVWSARLHFLNHKVSII